MEILNYLCYIGKLEKRMPNLIFGILPKVYFLILHQFLDGVFYERG